MKRTILIFSLAVVLLGLSIWEQIFLNNTLDEVISKGKIMAEIIETQPSIVALNYVDELDELWEQKEKRVCLFINHENIEKLGEQLLKVKDKLLANENEEALQEANLFVFYADGCKHLLVSSIQNVI